MSQQSKLGKGNTTVYTREDMMRVRFHYTDVVSWNDKEIILNTGGWFSATTKTRMNQASRQFDLGYSVYSKDYQWYVHQAGAESDILFDGNTVTLTR